RGAAEAAVYRMGADYLIQVTKTGKPEDAAPAAHCLEFLGPKQGPKAMVRVVEALRSALKARDDNVGKAAGFALAAIGPRARSAVPDLETVLNDRSLGERRREAAVAGLWGIRTPRERAFNDLLTALL